LPRGRAAPVRYRWADRSSVACRHRDPGTTERPRRRQRTGTFRATLLAVPLSADRPLLATVLAGRLLPGGGRLLRNRLLLGDALRTAGLAGATPWGGGTGRGVRTGP